MTEYHIADADRIIDIIKFKRLLCNSYRIFKFSSNAVSLHKSHYIQEFLLFLSDKPYYYIIYILPHILDGILCLSDFHENINHTYKIQQFISNILNTIRNNSIVISNKILIEDINICSDPIICTCSCNDNIIKRILKIYYGQNFLMRYDTKFVCYVCFIEDDYLNISDIEERLLCVSITSTEKIKLEDDLNDSILSLNHDILQYKIQILKKKLLNKDISDIDQSLIKEQIKKYKMELQ
jgi:hypothetical protein